MGVAKHHTLVRTSEKGFGEKFIGRCVQCGKEGLTFDDLTKEMCPNPLGLTQDEALIEVMLDEPSV